MAQNDSVGGLYLRLGLNLSELETGFVTAEHTVIANVRRLNREAERIRLRAEVEIAGLDEVNDAERILEIRTDSLNRRIAIQRDRIRLLSAAYRDVARTQGETSVAAQRAAVRLERERLALANLERDLRWLSAAQEETNGVLGELSNMLPAIPTKLQAVGAAAGAVAAGVGAAGAATKELIEEFRELQKQSYELNMPFADTREFLREMKLAGGEISDFEGYIRGITDAWVKGEYDDPEFIALRKYGAQITDATGRLKDFKDITDEVYRAWQQADAAGEGIEFLQLTGGEMGIRDTIQYFKRLEEAKADAAKIFKAEIDDKELHELDRTFALLDEQATELKNALGDIFAPAAQTAAENFFSVLHDGTAILVENKDEIQSWGFVAAATFETIGEKLHELTSWQMPNTSDEKVNQMLDGLQWQMQAFNDRALWGDDSPWSEIFLKLPRDVARSLGILDRAEKKQREYADAVKDAKHATDNLSESLAEQDKALEQSGEVLSQYAQRRVQEFNDELADLKIELEFGGNDYLKELAQLDLWRDREKTFKLSVSPAEGKAIDDLYAAKLEQIEQSRADKLDEIRQSVDAEFKTSLENRIDKIKAEKDAWIGAGMETAEAMELAQRRIDKAVSDSLEQISEEYSAMIDTVKGKLQSLDDKIFELDHSQYENDLRKIQQEYVTSLFDLQSAGALDAATKRKLDYLKGAVWLINDESLAQIRKLQDSTKNFLWQPSLQESEPPRLLGDPVYSSPFMPTPQSGNIAILYGDFKNYFVIGERGSRVVKPLRELYAMSDLTAFLMIERVDAVLTDTNAVKGLYVS